MSKTNKQFIRQTQRTPENTISSKGAEEARSIDWNEWWPFTRATGDALRQLNKRSRKQSSYPDDVEEALL